MVLIDADTILINEVESTRLAAYITGGLVPMSDLFNYEGTDSIVQPYFPVDFTETERFFSTRKPVYVRNGP